MNKLCPLLPKAIFLSMLSLLIAVNNAFALQEDRQLPLDIVSDWSEFYNNEQGAPSGIYRGNVVLTQGNLTIHADEATFKLIDGELDNIIATGNPVKIKDLPQLNEPWIFGEGLILSYFPKKSCLSWKKTLKLSKNKMLLMPIKSPTILIPARSMLNAARMNACTLQFKWTVTTNR